MPDPYSANTAAPELPAATGSPAGALTEHDLELALKEASLPEFSLPVREQLTLYLSLLMKWNKAMNLVGAKDWRTALVNLVADSFFLDRFLANLPLNGEPETWDLGAGAGLPGIPLRIIRKQGVHRMIEAREKRALFISNALAQLKLPAVFVHQARVEAFFKTPPGAPKAQIILSRAFKPWAEVLELVRPHLTPDGFVIIMSNGFEIKTAPQGWENASHMIYKLPCGTRMFQAFKLSI